MNKFFFACAAALAFSTAAIGAGTDQNQQKPDEQKICRKYSVTGSIMPPKKVCHSKAEWAQIDGKNADDTARTYNNPRASTGQ